jgi:hypothetical protein
MGVMDLILWQEDRRLEEFVTIVSAIGFRPSAFHTLEELRIALPTA